MFTIEFDLGVNTYVGLRMFASDVNSEYFGVHIDKDAGVVSAVINFPPEEEGDYKDHPEAYNALFFIMLKQRIEAHYNAILPYSTFKEIDYKSYNVEDTVVDAILNKEIVETFLKEYDSLLIKEINKKMLKPIFNHFKLESLGLFDDKEIYDVFINTGVTSGYGDFHYVQDAVVAEVKINENLTGYSLNTFIPMDDSVTGYLIKEIESLILKNIDDRIKKQKDLIRDSKTEIKRLKGIKKERKKYLIRTY